MSVRNNSYFDSYGDLSIHELMLKDDARTSSYENFLNCHAHLVHDKVVLDVGSGSGILSLFVARAGAKKVYAVEANDRIANISIEIINLNGFSDKIVVINDRVENIDIEKVDVIISEWMGFYLLHESMLDSVIFARDRFLKQDGIMVPALANIYACPTSLDSLYKANLESWRSFHGFNFSLMGEHLLKTNTGGGINIMKILPSDLIGEPKLLATFDLKYVDINDLNRIVTSLQFSATKYSVLRGYAFWFSVNFIDSSDDESFVQTKDILETGPSSPETHWKQTIVTLPEAYLVSINQRLDCNVEFVRLKYLIKESNNDEVADMKSDCVDKDLFKGENVHGKIEADKLKLEICNSNLVDKTLELEISRQYRIILQLPDDNNEGDDDADDDDDADMNEVNSEEDIKYEEDIRTQIENNKNIVN